MALINNLDDIRNINADLLMTDALTDTELTRIRDSVEIKVLNEVAHAYIITAWTSANVPNEIKTAILDWAAGQAIIQKYSDDKDLITLGREYKKDAKDLLKNIVEGKRRLEDESKAATAATPANSIVYDSLDKIDVVVNSLLTDIGTGRYSY